MIDFSFFEDTNAGHTPKNMLSVADWLDYQAFWLAIIGEAIYAIH